MSSKIFKISAVAATIAASFAANAALYNVYLDETSGISPNTSRQIYGSAISPETTVCWSNSCDADTSVMVTEVKYYREGFSYRDEAPFFLPFGWDYLDDNHSGFKDYCRNYLGYADTLCENWATAQYTNGYAREQGGNYDSSIAYLDANRDGTATAVKAENTVVNSINFSGGGPAVEPVGNARNGGTNRNIGFVGSDSATYTIGDANFLSSHAWVSKTLATNAGNRTFTLGSVTRNNVDTGNTKTFTSKPTVWLDVGSTRTEINWEGAKSEDGNSKAQGSARDIILDSSDNNNVYAVGYTSDGSVRLKAAVFKSTDSGSTWKDFSNGSKLVSGFPYATEEYANQTLQAVNNNKIAIGTAKLRRALNGAYANTLFYVNSLDSPSYNGFAGSIFFEGANGLAGNINNYNDVVGTIDYEQHSETNGKPRAQRAFIANLSNVPGSSAPIGGQARYLDDLTYGSGVTADNNKFRVIQAADINDAGVIAATAYYCAAGFESEAIDAKCAAGAALAGVKLVPINGQDSGDISPRPVTQTKVERQGGSLGILMLTVLGLLGFRRK
ncbi:DUF3466 family protein [Vibrio europaeus]|uniref:DUF3466 family protein n=1 Tax=Vibrio europaeus TaxID=300876 RepID=UPI00233F4337|nr:DUF3466 family protein [Vibrio europaeus]MDC5868840.1 DUF3466 family protein [Vibrio europaeus]